MSCCEFFLPLSLSLSLYSSSICLSLSKSFKGKQTFSRAFFPVITIFWRTDLLRIERTLARDLNTFENDFFLTTKSLDRPDPSSHGSSMCNWRPIEIVRHGTRSVNLIFQRKMRHAVTSGFFMWNDPWMKIAWRMCCGLGAVIQTYGST